MDKLIDILDQLKNLGVSGIKISFEDEGALLNEMITMRAITRQSDLELSVKIGGCEAKRDIIDCINLDCETIVAPMIESKFALDKFLKSLSFYNYNKKKGFNLETIGGFKNLTELSEIFNKVDFVTVGRVDFVASIDKNRDYVDTEEMYNTVEKIFQEAKNKGVSCYMGGAISIKSQDFIKKLMTNKLLDKFETRYIIYDCSKINIYELDKLLYLGNMFEVNWLKYINNRYSLYANKDLNRIKMIQERIEKNPVII
jgi:hypothetical protein